MSRSIKRVRRYLLDWYICSIRKAIDWQTNSDLPLCSTMYVATLQCLFVSKLFLTDCREKGLWTRNILLMDRNEIFDPLEVISFSCSVLT